MTGTKHMCQNTLSELIFIDSASLVLFFFLTQMIIISLAGRALPLCLFLEHKRTVHWIQQKICHFRLEKYMATNVCQTLLTFIY